MKSSTHITLSDILAIFFPVLLVVPNLMIWIYSGSNAAFSNFTSLILAAGIYWLLLSLLKRTWLAVLIALPLMVLCAFQIVVVFLYNDPAPIGVDMFLNVLTTNSSEVNELLSSLLIPVGLVCAVYLPPIIMGIIAAIRRQTTKGCVLKSARISGSLLSVAGLILTAVLYLTTTGFNILSDYFPLNVFVNIAKACERAEKTAAHSENAESFSFNAVSTRPDEPEIYIAVIGETSRADNWGIAGYERNTTPRLDSIGEKVVLFRGVMSECNVTHKAVPMLLSTVTAESFEDSIYFAKSIISAFKEAGFHTAFVSNQAPNKSFIDDFAAEADDLVYTSHTNGAPCDQACLPAIDSLLRTNHLKKLIVVHQYGSHYKYQDRYPRSLAKFLPDDISQNSYEHRETLINAYDNTIVNTDFFLAELINRLSALNQQGALLYCSDHGEDIHDDARHRFLHASPAPTFEQLHVPMLFYANDRYETAHPEIAARTEYTRNMLINSSQSFSHSLMHMAGIDSFRLDPEESVFSPVYVSPDKLCFLNDWNRSVSLRKARFHTLDFARLEKLEHSLYDQNISKYEKNIAYKSHLHDDGGHQYLAGRIDRED